MPTSEFVVLRRRKIVLPTLDHLSRPFDRRASFTEDLIRVRMERMDFDPEFDLSPVIKVEKAELSSKELNDLRRDDEVLAAAPSMPLEPIAPTEINVLSEEEASALSSSTWGIKAVRADESPYDGKGITVAVLDTGIDPTHPAFAGVALERRNFTSEGDDDENGHGTHCAGTIFGQDVGHLRIGIARGVKVKCLEKAVAVP